MPRFVKLSLGDTEVSGVEQDFEISREEWNEYKLLDGGVVRLKTTVQRIYKIVDDDGNPTYNDQGEPQMLIRHKSDVVTREY